MTLNNQPENSSSEFPSPPGPRHPSPQDIVLFAMELLSPEEASLIAQHMESCSECRLELSHAYSDLALCAATVELQSPPAQSRERLMQQVAREKKVVPIAAPRAAQQKAPQQEAAPHPPFAAFGRSGSILSIDDHPPKHTGRTVFAVVGWAIAATLAVAVTLQYKDRDSLHTTLAYQAAVLERLNADAIRSHQLMDALTDPKAVRVTLTAKPLPKAQPTGGVTYDPDKGSLIFLASNLDPLQTYKTYELWVIPTAGAPIPAGTFRPDDQGNASVIMPDLPKGVTAKGFGVTIEADGGSQVPTPPIIMSGN
jgi:anti-sigma-K factor RskA